MRKLLGAKELGATLRTTRIAKGWPLAKDFAERIKKDPSELSRWETGRVRPDFDTVVNFSKVLGVPPSTFMEPDQGEASVRNGQGWSDLVGAGSNDLRAALVAEITAIRQLDEPERMKMLYRDSAASLIGQAAIFAAELARIEAESAAKMRAEAVLEAERNGVARRKETTPQSAPVVMGAGRGRQKKQSKAS